MKKHTPPLSFIILLCILLGSYSNAKADCPAVNVYSFSVSSNLICPNSSVSFSSWADDMNTIEWDFGNGKTSNDSYASSIYTTPGKYYVTCLITNSCGSDSLITDSIVVSSSIPYFTSNATPFYTDSVCPNEPASFNIIGDYKAIHWSFDNGHSESENDAKEKFATLGDHPFSLMLTDFCDNDTTVYGKTVVRNSSQFSGSVNLYVPDSVCSKAYLSFYSSNSFQNNHWTFGDGDSLISNQTDVSHVYKANGKYTVSLTVTDYCGNKMKFTDTVIVDSGIYPELDDLSNMTDTVCPGDDFHVSISASNADDFNWDMNDGTYLKGNFIHHKYTSAGMHYFSVKISNKCGHEITVADSIYVATNHKSNLENNTYEFFNEEACLGDNFTVLSFPFNNMTFFLGDGNTVNEKLDSLVNFSETSTLEIGLTSFSYTALGTYNVSATFTNGCGIKDTITIGDINVVTNAPAEAFISLEFFSDSKNDIIYVNTPTSFYIGNSSNYYIDYGDGTTKSFTSGTLAIEKHTYTAEGTYNVSLKATNSCGNSDSTGITVKVVKDPGDLVTVNEISAANMDVTAYPNPTSDVVTFKFNSIINENVLFTIYNLQGQLIHQQNITNTNKVEFDFSQLNAGLYNAGFVSETQNTTKKVVLIK